jgi:hypothetical protein
MQKPQTTHLDIVDKDEQLKLRLSLKLPQREYIAGKGYFASAWLTNLSDRDPTFSGSGNMLGVVVLDKSNKVVWPRTHRRSIPYNMKLTSEQKDEALFRIDKPGTYKVVCRLNSTVEKRAGAGFVALKHQTEPITITVIPSPKRAPKDSTSTKFETIWLKEGGMITPRIAYQGYTYEPAYTGKTFNVTELRHVGSYEDLQFYARKRDMQVSPLRLWASTRFLEDTDTASLGLYVRGYKVDKKHPQIIRSVKSDSKLRLTLELPEQQHYVGQRYTAKATLTNISSEYFVLYASSDLFDVKVVDEGGNQVWPPKDFGGLWSLGKYPMTEGKGYSTEYAFWVDKPGTYRLLCSTNDGEREVGPPNYLGHRTTTLTPYSPPRLEVEPITFTIRP